MCSLADEGKGGGSVADIDKVGESMILKLPLSVTLPRKTKADKVFTLNLNIYRNTHHMTLNQAKAAWKEVVAQEVDRGMYSASMEVLPPPPYAFTYTVYPGSNRAFDLGNVLPIIQKFTDDALIEIGIIPDDNFKVVRQINYNFGEVDKGEPRAELLIEALR